MVKKKKVKEEKKECYSFMVNEKDEECKDCPDFDECKILSFGKETDGVDDEEEELEEEEEKVVKKKKKKKVEKEEKDEETEDDEEEEETEEGEDDEETEEDEETEDDEEEEETEEGEDDEEEELEEDEDESEEKKPLKKKGLKKLKEKTNMKKKVKEGKVVKEKKVGKKKKKNAEIPQVDFRGIEKLEVIKKKPWRTYYTSPKHKNLLIIVFNGFSDKENMGFELKQIDKSGSRYMFRGFKAKHITKMGDRTLKNKRKIWIIPIKDFSLSKIVRVKEK